MYDGIAMYGVFLAKETFILDILGIINLFVGLSIIETGIIVSTGSLDYYLYDRKKYKKWIRKRDIQEKILKEKLKH
jgi:hypothetical protein